MPPDGGQQPEWARAAEELVRRVRNLVEDHGDAVERALTESLGSQDAARAEIRKLDLLAQVLDVELWRRGNVKPSRKLVGHIAAAAMGALAIVGVQTTNHITADAYEAITGTQTQAETVAQQCDVDVDVDVFTLDHGRLDAGRVVEGQASAHIEVSGTATGIGQPVEHESGEVASQPRRLSSFSEPFYTGAGGTRGDDSADQADETSPDDEPIEAAPFGRSTAPGRPQPRPRPMGRPRPRGTGSAEP